MLLQAASFGFLRGGAKAEPVEQQQYGAAPLAIPAHSAALPAAPLHPHSYPGGVAAGMQHSVSSSSVRAHLCLRMADLALPCLMICAFVRLPMFACSRVDMGRYVV